MAYNSLASWCQAPAYSASYYSIMYTRRLHVCRNLFDQATWIPIAKTKLGTVDLTAPNSIQEFDLSAAGVPPEAKEVLVYATISTGWNENADKDAELTLWTSIGQQEYKKFLYAHPYKQDAWSYNSENMSFPAPMDMKLRVEYTGPASSGTGGSSNNMGSTVYVTGYRL